MAVVTGVFVSWPWIGGAPSRLHHKRFNRTWSLRCLTSASSSNDAENLGGPGSVSISSESSLGQGERIPRKVRRAGEAGKALEGKLMQRLSQTLIDRQLLGPGQKVLVAVSGGQDSVCLMHLLVKLQAKWGWNIGIAHCDHQWSPASRQQAAHVARMVQSLGLDYYQAVTTTPVLGEGVARAWRYGILQRIATAHGYEAIVTAHTASDRVETLLFNVFRGTGMQGLQSLTWKRLISSELFLLQNSAFEGGETVESIEDPFQGTLSMMGTETNTLALIRPLLDVTRTELRELALELKLPVWPDPSNHSLDIGRNRIRHHLLPYLRKHFNPGVDKSLARWAEILHGEQEYLDDLCESIRVNAESEFTQNSDDYGAEEGRKLDITLLRPLPIALQRRILKQFSDRFTQKSLGFDIVERVRQACMDLSTARKGLKVSVPGGCFLHIRRNELLIARFQAKVS